MVTNFSEVPFKVGEEEYKLFINRKGIVSWENITKFSKKATEMENKYKKTIKDINSDEPIEVDDNTNPFDYSISEELDKIEEDEALLREIYMKFYWIALYENHKLSITDAKVIFEKAEEEYGIGQLVELANKMIENANQNLYGNKELKKLEALNLMK